MSLADELKDPWGLLVAGVSGGMAWALVGAVPVGLAVGAGVLGVKVLSGVLLDRDGHDDREAAALPAPRRGSAAEHWLVRARTAVRALEQAAPTGAGPQAHETLDAVERLGAQTVVVERALARVDAAGLDEETARVAEQARRAGPAVQDEIARSAAALADRVAVRDRLRQTHDTVLARMQSAALGLESVAARMAEVAVLGETAGGTHDTGDQVARLLTEVEGLRVGLAEAEALSRRVLDGPAAGTT